MARTKEALSALYNAVNTAHAFREGNGRTQRQFFNDLAACAGFKIDWTSVPKHVNDAASEAARGGDDSLTAMFDRIVTETPERSARTIGLAGFAGPGAGPTQSLSDQGPRLGAGLSRGPYEGRGR